MRLCRQLQPSVSDSTGPRWRRQQSFAMWKWFDPLCQ